MKHPTLFASDLHGDRYAYERLFSMAETRGIETVILGGDLTPKWPVFLFGVRGAVIPGAPALLRTDNRYTYVDFLMRVQEDARKRGRLQQARHWVNLGGYEVHVPQEEVSLKDLLAEQRILRRVIDEFRPYETGPSFEVSLQEWEILEPLLREAMKKSPLANVHADSFMAALRYATFTFAEKAEVARALVSVRNIVQGKGAPASLRQYGKVFQDLLEPFLSGEVQTSMGHAQALAQTAALSLPLHRALEAHHTLSRATSHQVKFLRHYLTNRIRAYRKRVPNGRVYFILGNDDTIECVPVARAMHSSGVATYLPLGQVEHPSGLMLAGYSYVPTVTDREFYPEWEKEEEVIGSDLRRLEMASAGRPTIYVVHCPPSSTALDLAWGGKHYGSVGVNLWLQQSRKHAVLSGHIHEAPFLNGGVWRESIAGTPCFQPGGWHDEGLCAVLFDASDPSQAEWIHDATKIQSVR